MKNNEMITEMLDNLTKSVIESVNDDIQKEIVKNIVPQIEDRIHKMYGFLPEIHEIKTETTSKVIKAITHEKFDEVLKIK
jgi:predicted ArsR family transcriptional regulator